MTEKNGSTKEEYTITFTTVDETTVNIAVTGFPEDPDAAIPSDAGATVCLRVLELMAINGMIDNKAEGGEHQ